MNNKILMNFYSNDLEEIVVITDDDDNIYVLNKTKCIVTNYNPMSSLLDVFKLINFEEEVKVNYDDIAGLSYYIGLYADEMDSKIVDNMMRILTKQN